MVDMVSLALWGFSIDHWPKVFSVGQQSSPKDFLSVVVVVYALFFSDEGLQ